MEHSKYDFDWDMVNTNSLSLIINQIKRGSTVLEFGPANGRMTKYLKEALDCKVYLVEIDDEPAREAIKYGEDLVVDDIENSIYNALLGSINTEHSDALAGFDCHDRFMIYTHKRNSNRI